MSYNSRIYIRFRDAKGKYEIYRSPMFEAPFSLWENETLDDLVCDGDDETDFFFNCDMEGRQFNDITTIVWLMFEPFDKDWVKQLMEVWERHFAFELPKWSEWEKIGSLDEAYK